MKKIIFILFLTFSFLLTTNVFADQYKGHKQRNHSNYQYHHNETKKYDGWAYYHGHTPRSHYRHNYHNHFHNYNYEGHWSTWRDWERYYMRNKHIYHHGHYEKYNDHLFFLFDDGLNRFMFSIGR